jgi:hypothetical protein
MKAEDSQQIISRELHSKKVDRGPCSRQTMPCSGIRENFAPAATEPDHSAEFPRIPLRSVRAVCVTLFHAGVIISREFHSNPRTARSD